MFPTGRFLRRNTVITLSVCLLVIIAVFFIDRPSTWDSKSLFSYKKEADLKFPSDSITRAPDEDDSWTESSSSDEDDEDTKAWAKKVGQSLALYREEHMKTDTFIRNRFIQRQQNLSRLCKKPEYTHMPHKFKTQGRKANIAFKRLRWCMVPKVGTTFLKHLERSVFKPSYSKIKNNSTFDFDKSRKSFFLVREPYSRLVSAYIGKIMTNAPWWKMYGTYIVKNFREDASRKSKFCGSDVTFPEFLKYFIHAQNTGEKKNPHFIPSHEMCHVCGKPYDFIGHLETFKDDLSYIFHSVNISLRLDLSDERLTVSHKAQSVVNHRNMIEKCEDMCDMLQRTWWSFQARGLIADTIQMPVRSSECSTIKPKKFAELALAANIDSQGKIDKRKQKRDHLVKLYLEVPLKDRLTVQSLLKKDFELHGYDPQPHDIFPDLG